MLEFKDKIIMAVAAHPDDNDFAAGATMAKAAKEGARIIYIIATSGQRGSSEIGMDSEKLSDLRRKEQECACKILGVKELHFLDYKDGELEPNLMLKERIVVFIRRYKPHIVLTMDPTHYYYKKRGMVNHSDHRAIGIATMDACYPLARDLMSFPEHQKQGLAPHKAKELLFPSFAIEEANLFIDVTDSFETKLLALECHRSQIADMATLTARMKERAIEIGKKAGCNYAEAFVRLKLPD